jgi:hypothetical protein
MKQLFTKKYCSRTSVIQHCKLKEWLTEWFWGSAKMEARWPQHSTPYQSSSVYINHWSNRQPTGPLELDPCLRWHVFWWGNKTQTLRFLHEQCIMQINECNYVYSCYVAGRNMLQCETKSKQKTNLIFTHFLASLEECYLELILNWLISGPCVCVLYVSVSESFGEN